MITNSHLNGDVCIYFRTRYIVNDAYTRLAEPTPANNVICSQSNDDLETDIPQICLDPFDHGLVSLNE